MSQGVLLYPTKSITSPMSRSWGGCCCLSLPCALLLLSVELSSFLLLQPTSQWQGRRHRPRPPSPLCCRLRRTVKLSKQDSTSVSQSADAALPLRPNSTNTISVCAKNIFPQYPLARLRPPNNFWHHKQVRKMWI